MTTSTFELPLMPIVVGAPRSGTTLLRFMLDAHPSLAIPPETGFLALGSRLAEGSDQRASFFATVTAFPPEAPAWSDFGLSKGDFEAALDAITPFSVREGCRAFYRLYAARFGKDRWGDKTPLYCQHLPAIAGLLPEARFVHVIRDGRDVALSLRQMWFSPGQDIETLARHWVECVTAARRDANACAGYLEVRFEDLVTGTEAELRKICAYLELDYSPRMLDYHRYSPARLAEHVERRRADGSIVVTHAQRLRQQELTTSAPQRSRIEAWKHQMSNDERQRFEGIAGSLLEQLGYCL